MRLSKEIWLVVVVLILAALLRMWRIEKDVLIGYDQGFDLMASLDIWKGHHLTLLGPVADTDVGGIYFGPLYRYLISIPLSLTKGNPASVIIFLIMLEIVSMIFFYKGAKRLFGKKVAFLSFLVMTSSYGLISYSRWMSNAMPVLMFGNLLVYCVSGIIARGSGWRGWWLVLGLIFGFDSAAGIGLFIFGVIWRLSLRPKIREVISNAFWFLLPAVPQIIFELRHDFLSTRGVLRIFTQDANSVSQRMTDWLLTIGQLKWFTEGVLMKGIPMISLLALATIIFSLFINDGRVREKKTLFWFCFCQVGVMFLFQRMIFGHFFAAIMPVFIILAVNSWLILWRKIGVLIVIIVIIFNLYIDVSHFNKPALNLTPIGTANLVTLENRLKMIDFIQQSRGRGSYTLWTYTIPYYYDGPWDYLIWWRSMDRPIEKGKIIYALYERDWDKPQRQLDWLGKVNSVSVLVERRKAGDFTVEKRTWKNQ